MTAEPGFRSLYDAVLDCDPDALADYLSGEGVAAARPLMRPLQPYRRRDSPAHPYDVRREALWEWFALSCVNDYLLLAYQGSHLTTPKVPPGVYADFFAALGFEVTGAAPFTPFHHEVVEAGWAAAGDLGVRIERTFWPGLRFGDLLFSRAGVGVTAAPAVLDPRIAPRSTLYFANRRLRRATSDLSHGWGHNSRWRTAFRRDYEDAGHYHFNVDGTIDLGGPPPALAPGPGDAGDDLPLDARRELLMHRCFVTCPLPGDDRFPFDDRLTVAKPG